MKPRTKGKRISVVSGVILLTVLMITTWFFWEHIQFWRLFESLGRNEQGYPQYRHRDTGIVMVRVPGGTFMMGSPESESGRRPDETQHEVVMNPFLIAKYELTHGQWKLIVGNSPQGMNFFPSEGDSFPVRNTHWSHCRRFCEETGLCLPSEAQWEFACRAGSQGAYAGTEKLDEMGWYKGNSGVQTHAVGLKQPNAFGLFDMHGNVSEWCADIKDGTFYSRPEARGPDPMYFSDSLGDARVNRGGSAFHEAAYCRSATRGADRPGDQESDHGFRPAYFPLP